MKKLITLLSFVLLFGTRSFLFACYLRVWVGILLWYLMLGFGCLDLQRRASSLWYLCEWSWSFAGNISFTQGNLCPGVYTYLVIDANGDTCTGGNNFIIPIGVPPTVQLNVVNATCSICNDGAVSAVASGGSAPYTYTWSNSCDHAFNCEPVLRCLLCVSTRCKRLYVYWHSLYVGVGNNGFYALQGRHISIVTAMAVRRYWWARRRHQAVTVPQGPFTALSNFQGDYVFVLSPGTYDANFVGAPRLESYFLPFHLQ